MTDMSCSYGTNRDEVIVAYLYDDTDGNAERVRFETHLAACARCRAEVAALRGVRKQLAHWSPPEINLHTTISNEQSGWWRAIPVWAQVAAAMLFLGVSAGIANLDVRYDQNGLTVRTGWSGRAGGAGGAGGAGLSNGPGAAATTAAQGAQPWKADIAALESQLKNEIRAAQAAPAVRTVSAPASDAEVTRRVRALVDESEKRQKTELALRLAELLRDVHAQRQADLVKIDRTLGLVQNSMGIEVMKNRQQIDQMNVLYRASQRQ